MGPSKNLYTQIGAPIPLKALASAHGLRVTNLASSPRVEARLVAAKLMSVRFWNPAGGSDDLIRHGSRAYAKEKREGGDVGGGSGRRVEAERAAVASCMCACTPPYSHTQARTALTQPHLRTQTN
jgi:hypothetical protein